MKSRYFPRWTQTRINFIHKHYPARFFNGKKILELAPYRGDIGNHFYNVGADVHLIEGRQENVNEIKKLYPHLKVTVADLDSPDWDWGKYDVIINFGLYYHLQNYHHEHLVNCIRNCRLMFFESVIFDSNDSKIFYRKESGPDQSMTNVGGTPTTSYVEDILNASSVNYTKYSDSDLNAEHHHYDWKDSNSEIFDGFSRRMWIIEND